MSETLYCSFCNKSQHEVQQLIAGDTVYICDACIDLCTVVCAEDRQRKREGQHLDEIRRLGT